LGVRGSDNFVIVFREGEEERNQVLAIVSSGSESLVDETRSAVVNIGPRKITALGGVALD